MRRRFIASCYLLIAAIGLAMAAPAAAAQAATAASGQGGNALRISPVRYDLEIKPGSSKTVDVTVTNLTNQPATLKAVINDFGAGDDESGKPKLYLDENSSAPSHGLRRYIKPVDNIVVQPQEHKKVSVTIAMPKDAAGGGYYGIVRFVPAGVSSEKSLTLTGSVGTLLLVTVPGDVKEQAGVVSFNVARDNGKASSFFVNGGKDADGKGLQSVLRVRNSGNVQVAPFGKLILKKGDTVLGEYEINNTEPRGSVLPDSIRRFAVDLGGKTASLGKYTIQGSIGYGSAGQLVNVATSFYVVPLSILIGALILLLAIAAFLIGGRRMLKAHDRRLIRKLRGK